MPAPDVWKSDSKAPAALLLCYSWTTHQAQEDRLWPTIHLRGGRGITVVINPNGPVFIDAEHKTLKLQTI